MDRQLEGAGDARIELAVLVPIIDQLPFPLSTVVAPQKLDRPMLVEVLQLGLGLLELVAEDALDEAAFEHRRELAPQAEPSSALSTQQLHVCRTLVLVLILAFATGGELLLQGVEALRTVVMLIQQAFLSPVEVRADRDLGMLLIERLNSILVMEDIVGELVGVGELLLGVLEDWGEVDFVVDKDEFRGLAEVE